MHRVFLLSLKAGGVALNLTEASHVFIVDPWWNPAVELQAMDVRARGKPNKRLAFFFGLVSLSNRLTRKGYSSVSTD
jgi:hypothetical protein